MKNDKGSLKFEALQAWYLQWLYCFNKTEADEGRNFTIERRTSKNRIMALIQAGYLE
jgi:hypothetical protein